MKTLATRLGTFLQHVLNCLRCTNAAPRSLSVAPIPCAGPLLCLVLLWVWNPVYTQADDSRGDDVAAKVQDQMDKLFADYLKGDLAIARASLKAAIRVVDEAKLPEFSRAAGLEFAYSRLFVLEKKQANAALAEAYLVKTRYWRLRKVELSGHSEAEAADDIATFTGEKCQQMVEKSDKRLNGGEAPAYTRAIPAGDPR